MNPSEETTIKCIGCGAEIQTTDKNKEGFIPASALEKRENLEEIYCQRCFRLRHYNDPMDIELDDDQFLRILNEISQTEALVVMVVDLFDFNGSFIQGIQRFALDNPILIVGNKVDLLPHSVRESTIRQWMMMRSHELGVRPEKVILSSAKNDDLVQELMSTIEELRKGKDVYIVGATNVGKSSLVNKIISQGYEDESVITTSYFPGTTLGKIEIPLDDGSHLVDTPGIIQKHQLSYYLDTKDLKQVTPKKTLKPKAYQLNAGQTLFLGGLGRYDVVSSNEKASFIVYVSSDVAIHRTKLENADAVYESLAGTQLTPPQKNEEINFSKHTFKTTEKSDILISGLGWVTVDPEVTLTVHAPKGVGVFMRPALIG